MAAVLVADGLGLKCTYTDTREFVGGSSNPTFGLKISNDVTWRLFYPKCPAINAVCNPLGGAYVSAITVCNQRLF